LIWQNDSDFAVLDNDIVGIYRNFEKAESIKIHFTPQKIFEGVLLGVADLGTTLFYDWNSLTKPLHSLSLGAEKIWWDDDGSQVAISTE
jgi:hypothetical protein